METTYEYLHTLRNRIMALRAKIEARPRGGDLQFNYGRDVYQEETRSMGLRMIRDGLDKEGEELILNFTREHYPTSFDIEKAWISKMMHYLNTITDTLIDNLLAEGYIALRANTDLPYENAIFYPIQTLTEDHFLFNQLNIRTLLSLNEEPEKLEGWVYFRSGRV